MNRAGRVYPERPISRAIFVVMWIGCAWLPLVASPAGPPAGASNLEGTTRHAPVAGKTGVPAGGEEGYHELTQQELHQIDEIQTFDNVKYTGLRDHVSHLYSGNEMLVDRLLRVASEAPKNQRPNGNYEDNPGGRDVGDDHIGVVSLIMMLLSEEIEAGQKHERLARSVRDAVDFFLEERVYRKDPQNTQRLQETGTGLPYARYRLSDADGAGDWPTTAWALLNIANTLRYDSGVLTDDQRAELRDVGFGMWRWLNEAGEWDHQNAQNQALGAIAGACMLANVLDDAGETERAEKLRERAAARYEQERSNRATDRGYRIWQEHGAGYDANYGTIALSMNVIAARAADKKRMFRDAEEFAEYVDMRLSATGYDYGGPRHHEAGATIEDVPGLNFFDGRLRTDLGRYLGDYRRGAGFSSGYGHFAWMYIAAYELFNESGWITDIDVDTRENSRYKLRHSGSSVTFTERYTPYLISVSETEIIQSVVNGRHGLGPVGITDHGRKFIAPRLEPEGGDEGVHAEWKSGSMAVKFVNRVGDSAFDGRVTCREVYIATEDGLYQICMVAGPGLGGFDRLAYQVGLPYLYRVPDSSASSPGACRKIVKAIAPADGAGIYLGDNRAQLETAGPLSVGNTRLESNGVIRVRNPGYESDLPDEEAAFSTGATIDSMLGQVGWERDIVRTNWFEVVGPRIKEDTGGAVTFAVRWGADENGSGGQFTRAPSAAARLDTAVVETVQFLFAYTVGEGSSSAIRSSGPAALLVEKETGGTIIKSYGTAVTVESSHLDEAVQLGPQSLEKR